MEEFALCDTGSKFLVFWAAEIKESPGSFELIQDDISPDIFAFEMRFLRIQSILFEFFISPLNLQRFKSGQIYSNVLSDFSANLWDFVAILA